jgi:hypothetical protein
MSLENSLEISNKVKIVKRGEKEYTYDASKYDTKKYVKTWKEKHPEKMKEIRAATVERRKNDTYYCDVCGCEGHWSNESRHKKGKMHLLIVKIRDEADKKALEKLENKNI